MWVALGFEIDKKKLWEVNEGSSAHAKMLEEILRAETTVGEVGEVLSDHAKMLEEFSSVKTTVGLTSKSPPNVGASVGQSLEGQLRAEEVVGLDSGVSRRDGFSKIVSVEDTPTVGGDFSTIVVVEDFVDMLQCHNVLVQIIFLLLLIWFLTQVELRRTIGMCSFGLVGS